MDFGKAFAFVFEDKDWIKKLAIGAVLALTAIGMIPVMGWALETARRVYRGDTTLPDWSDFGKLAVDGLKLIAIFFVWMLPLWLIVGCPSGIVGAIAGSADRADQGWQTLSILVQTCGGLVGAVYGVVVGILAPAAAGHLAVTEDLGKAINPATAFKLVRANPGTYLIVWLISGIAAGVLAFVGVLLCVIGVFVAAAYHSLVYGTLVGQAYRQNEAALAAPPSPA
jgi:hypothetical protein